MVTLWSAILLVTTSWWSVGFAAEARPPVRFGVQVAPEDTSYEAMVEVARLVEQLGYDTFWLNDHFAPVMGDKDGRTSSPGRCSPPSRRRRSASGSASW